MNCAIRSSRTDKGTEPSARMASWNARWSTIFANIWRGVPFVAITLLAGLQTISPSYYEAASLDGAAAWVRSALQRLQ